MVGGGRLLANIFEVDRANSTITLRAATAIGGDTNYTQIEEDGTLKFKGAATVFDDLRVPISAIRLAGAQPPSETAYKGGSVLAFSSVADKTIYFTVQIPHSYKEAAIIEPHIHWVLPVAGAGGGCSSSRFRPEPLALFR